MKPPARQTLLDALAEASSDALVGISADGDILSLNSAAEGLLGSPIADLIGQPIDLLLSAADQAGSHEAIAVLRGGGQVNPRRVGLLTADGVHTEADLSLTPVRDDQGKLHAIAGCLRVRNDSEQRWRQLAAAISVSLSIRPIGSTRFGYWNRAFTALLGLDVATESIEMADLTRLIHPDDLSTSLADVAAAEAGAYVERELRIVRPDGTEGWVRTATFPIRDAHGQPVSLARTMADITERKAVELRLIDSELRFRQLAAAVDVGFALRPVGSSTFSYLNRAFREILGIDPAAQTFESAELTRMVHPEDTGLDRSSPKSDGVIAAVDREFRIVRPDSELRWIRTSVAPVTDAAGTVVSFAGTVEDITDRKVAELALVESEGRFVQLAASLQVGVSLRQVEPPLVLYVNPRYVELVGWDPVTESGGAVEGVIGRLHPDDLARFERDYWIPAQTGAPSCVEIRMLHPAGKVQWLRLTSQAVTGPDGPTNRVAGTVEDITERKLAEAGTELARRDAERANAAKTDFLSRMSHELRTPLNAVLGFAQLLQLDALTAEQDSAVEHILRGGRHLLEMINDVLDIARIENDQLEVSLEPVNLTDLILDSVGLIRPLAADAGVELRAETREQFGTRYVRADRRRMQQVLLNLLSNAIKYNRAGGRVTLNCIPSGDGRILVRVSDTGRGIHENDLARLFVPFERLGEHTADVDGTGIGLALSQRLMTQMGGTLTATSTLGVGSAFTATLDLADPVVPASSRLDPITSVPQQSRLLFLDGNTEDVQLLQGIIARRAGWTLQSATLAELPGVLAEPDQPDLIVADGGLTDQQALRMLAGLRADPHTESIPVAIVAVDASHSSELRLRHAGAQHYLSKPVSVGQMLGLLDEHAVIARARPLTT